MSSLDGVDVAHAIRDVIDVIGHVTHVARNVIDVTHVTHDVIDVTRDVTDATRHVTHVARFDGQPLRAGSRPGSGGLCILRTAVGVGVPFGILCCNDVD